MPTPSIETGRTRAAKQSRTHKEGLHINELSEAWHSKERIQADVLSFGLCVFTIIIIMIIIKK